MLEKDHIAVKILEFSSLNSMRKCLARGIGLTICPAISVEKELKSNLLIRLNWDINHMETSVIMIWHAEKWCSPILKQFIDIVNEYVLKQ